MPGGVICVTREMLNVLRSESELAAVLAHEMGHIELSHCFDMVKYELLGKKLGDSSAGELADYLSYLFLNNSFSKTLENEADEYAFSILTGSLYDPSALSLSFVSMQKVFVKKQSSGKKEAGFIRDYMMSHPPIELRIEKFQSKAQVWWTMHSGQRRYIGRNNLLYMQSLAEKDYGEEEWASGADM